MAGAFVHEHARAAAEHHDVVVVHLDRTTAGPGLERLADESPPVWRIRYRRFPRPLSYVMLVLGLARVVALGGRPDIVHAFSLFAAVPAVVAGMALRRPVVYSEFWSVFLPEDPNTLRPTLRSAARAVLARSAFVLPVSTSLERGLRLLAPAANYRVVPNVVDGRIFAPRRNDATRRVLRVVSVGLMDDDSKGFDVLLDAAARCSTAFRLELVGDGVDRPRYEQQAHALGIADRVTFHGILSKPEIAAVLQSADAFVLASRFDTNPVVVLEALSCGLPVLATSVGGLPEVVTEDRGLLVPPEDADALAGGLTALFERLDEVDRSAIAAGARHDFGFEAVGRRLSAVYDEASTRSPRKNPASIAPE